MYAHRPDIFSLAFGILFIWIALAFLVDSSLLWPFGPAMIILAGGLTVAAGTVGWLIFGDVHRPEAVSPEHLTQGGYTDSGQWVAPDPLLSTATATESPLLDDLAFGSDLDAETLDRVYRETFGDDEAATETRTPPPRPANDQ
ncbi:MAG: hypothetical protein ACR2HR_08165 [Euzebya sp.]